MLFGKGSPHQGRSMLMRSKSIGGITSFTRASNTSRGPRFRPYTAQCSPRAASDDAHSVIPRETNKAGKGGNSRRKHGAKLKGKMESQKLCWSISEFSESFRESLSVGQSETSRKSSRNLEAQSRPTVKSEVKGNSGFSEVEEHGVDLPPFNFNDMNIVRSNVPETKVTRTENCRPQWSKTMPTPALRLCVPQLGPRIHMCSPSLFRHRVRPSQTSLAVSKVITPRENMPLLEGTFPEISNNIINVDLNISDTEPSEARGQSIGDASPLLDENYWSEREDGESKDMSDNLMLRKADTFILNQDAGNKDSFQSSQLAHSAKDRMMLSNGPTEDQDNFFEFFGTCFADFEKMTEQEDCVPTKSTFLATDEPVLYSPPPREGMEPPGLTPLSPQFSDLLPIHGTYTCAVCDTYLELMPFTCERSEFGPVGFNTTNKEGDAELFCPQCQCERCVFNFSEEM